MARPRQISDAEVLEIARACFIEQGPGVSTTVIAERVGLSQAALFKRFGTKKGLMLAALLPPAHPPFLAQIEAGPTEAPLADQLADIAMVVFSFFREVIPCVATLASSGFDKNDIFENYDIPPPVRTQIAIAQWFARAIEIGLVRPLPPVELATAFLGTLHVRAFMQHIGAPIGDDAAAYIRMTAELFARGLEPDAEAA